MYAELQETGKVIKTLPDDDKAIRKLHAKQVLRIPLEELDAQPLKPIGVQHTGPHVPAPAPKIIPRRRPAEDKVPVVASIPTVQLEPETPEPAAQPTPALKIVPEIVAPEPEPAIEAPAPETVETIAETETAPDPVPTEPVIVEEVKVEPPQAEPEPAKIEASVTEASEIVETDHLSRTSPVVDAPSIGPKTAARLETVNIITIGDLMDADPLETAQQLDVRYIKEETLKEWQDQTALMLAMPGLRVLDSQILVGAGIRSASDLAKASARSVLNAATTFLETPKGSRVLWGAEAKVDETEVKGWIDLAKNAA